MNGQNEDMVEISYTSLPEHILRAMLEEFVLREGTDYGHEEFDLERKISDVRLQLLKGKIRILFNAADESFDLVTR